MNMLITALLRCVGLVLTLLKVKAKDLSEAACINLVHRFSAYATSPRHTWVAAYQSSFTHASMLLLWFGSHNKMY